MAASVRPRTVCQAWYMESGGPYGKRSAAASAVADELGCGTLSSPPPRRRTASAAAAVSGRELFRREAEQLRRKCAEYLRGKLSATIRRNRVSSVADEPMSLSGRARRAALTYGQQTDDGGGSQSDAGATRQRRLFPGQRKFRRAARAIKLLINVCHICKDLLWYAITNESWYKMVDKILEETSEKGSVSLSTSTFSTLVHNSVTKEYEKLEFDASAYKRDYTAVNVVSDFVRHALMKKPGTRTEREIDEIVQCLRKSLPSVRPYTEEQQKKIAQCCMYDRYFQQRVILREGLQPDGIYFVLNGLLVENGAQTADTREIRVGEKFGEEELKVGSLRRSTVITKTSGVELLYIHKQDYTDIFDMNVEFDEDKILNICKKDFVMERYPLQKLAENPGTWTVLKFKYGRLIAEDSNRTEFVYVIKSGEARVIKSMARQYNDVMARRRRLQEERDAGCEFVRSFRLLDFMSRQRTVKSAYDRKSYLPRPTTASATNERRCRSSLGDTLGARPRIGAAAEPAAAPVAVEATQSPPPPAADAASDEAELRGECVQDGGADLQHQAIGGSRRVKFAACAPDSEASRTAPTVNTGLQRAVGARKTKRASRKVAPQPHQEGSCGGGESVSGGGGESVSGGGGDTSVSDAQSVKDAPEVKEEEEEPSNVPPFVQVESLHSGKVFGLRACLAEEEQGPSAALVSAGCEVLRIHRKFFMKFLDENLVSLIRLKAKPFPSQEELLNRLDVNLQWQEYCQGVMVHVLTRSADLEAGRR